MTHDSWVMRHEPLWHHCNCDSGDSWGRLADCPIYLIQKITQNYLWQRGKGLNQIVCNFDSTFAVRLWQNQLENSVTKRSRIRHQLDCLNKNNRTPSDGKQHALESDIFSHIKILMVFPEFLVRVLWEKPLNKLKWTPSCITWVNDCKTEWVNNIPWTNV